MGIGSQTENEEDTMFEEKMCQHNKCFQHVPDWGREKTDFFPAPTFFLRRKTFITHRCCGKSMLRMKKIRAMECRKCGSTTVEILDIVALCSCCGSRHEVISWNDGFAF